MTISRDTVYAVSDDVVAREIEGEIIIVPLVAGIGDLEDELFTLNETGKAIWDKLDGRRSLNEVIAELAAEYQAEPGEIETDVLGLVAGAGPEEDAGCRLSLPKPCLYSVPGGVLSLSGLALQEFLRAVLARGASFRFKARGFSMHPFIQDGDVVTVSPHWRQEAPAGGGGGFCHPETRKLMVHRVLARRQTVAICSGAITARSRMV